MDNPWNPFTHYREWLDYDNKMGYSTLGLLDYFSHATPDMDEDFYEEEYQHALAMLLEFNPYGVHMKVYKDEADKLIPLANEAYRVTLASKTA
jgi:hypothetical protein